jgi:LPXTG-site transpeptidase (sortase) family protein
MIKDYQNIIDLGIITLLIAIGIVIINNNITVESKSETELVNYCENETIKRQVTNQLMESAEFPPNSIIGTLYFPTLNTSTTIYQGDNLDGQKFAMDNGQAHDPATVLPGTTDSNISNNIVVAGHRHTEFKVLDELKDGDPIVFEVNGNVFLYEFYEKKIITPAQIEEVFKFSNIETLTLYTCWPLATNLPYDERLVISAMPVDEVVLDDC